MFRSLYGAGALWLLSGLWGCSTPNPNLRVHRRLDGFLEVDGPLAGPFKTLEELAQSACKLMTSQPAASNGNYGVEYCALHYYSASGGGFFLSYFSNIAENIASGTNGTKYCEMPQALRDPDHGDAVLLGGDHTHPYPRGFSKKDVSNKAHGARELFIDPVTHQVRGRELMLFFREKTGECRSFSYDNTTHVIAALRDGQWVPVGQANDEGDIQGQTLDVH